MQGGNPYGQQGYGYNPYGQGGYDQQQQWAYQQQMQQQWAYQQQMQQQQWQQQMQQQGKGQGGGYGGQAAAQDDGKGGGKGYGNQQNSKGGGKGGQGGAAPKKKPEKQEMTLEQFQAQKKEKEAARKAAQAAAAAAPKVVAPRPVVEEPAAEAPKAAEPKVEKPKAEEPKEEPKAEVEDWEQEEEEEEKKEEAPAPAPAPAVVEEKPPAPDPTPAPAAKPAAAPPAAAEEEEEEEAEAAVAKKGGKESELKVPDPRPHLNVVFIGHVDAGKSTTCGNILWLTGCVDERSMEKYQKEAKDKNRESWFLAYIMDTSEEEKAKGKTVEVGRAQFSTEKTRFTILDAPGHKSYVPNMISGASQADIGVLIISARKGEFETGFDRGGQTREHALLAMTLGVEKIVIAINKMDDPSVEWAEERYTEIVQKMTPFMKTAGFKDEQVIFLPISGLKGSNLKERGETPAWVKTPTLFEVIDNVVIPDRKKEGALRVPMLDGYRDMGAVMAIGKVEQGQVKPGMKCTIMPLNQKCTVQSVFLEEEEVQYANPGENVILKMSGCTDEHLCKGYVLCPVVDPVKAVVKFKAQLKVIELAEERPVLTAGYKAVLHVHTAIEECEITKLNEAMNLTKKGSAKEKNPRFAREGWAVWCVITCVRSTALDSFQSVPSLARFTLRDEGRTIAIGKIIELPKDKDSK